MGQNSRFRFETSRLLVDEWNSFDNVECDELDLSKIVTGILTPNVTESLPPAWQGAYSEKRANAWIEERSSEGETMLVVEKSSKAPVGLMIYFMGEHADIHLGYMFAESSWGRGLASELLSGFVEWGKHSSISTVYAGVSCENKASIRVLEKSGFKLIPETGEAEEKMFVLNYAENS